MASIFISYAHADFQRVERLADALRTFGHEVWWDDQLRAGEPFREVIEKYLSTVEAVIVIWTEVSLDSAWVNAEAAVAKDREVLVPVRFDKGIRPAGELGTVHIEFLGAWNQTANAAEIDRLNERISHLKSMSDLEKIANIVPLALRQTVQQSNSLKVLLDSAFPGGLRVYRFLLGTIATSAAIWLPSFALHQAANDAEIGFLYFVYFAMAVGISRAFNQIILASRQRYVDRFFDSAFSFCFLTSMLVGALFFSVLLLSGRFSLLACFDQSRDLSLIILLSLYSLRITLLSVSALQRRVH